MTKNATKEYIQGLRESNATVEEIDDDRKDFLFLLQDVYSWFFSNQGIEHGKHLDVCSGRGYGLNFIPEDSTLLELDPENVSHLKTIHDPEKVVHGDVTDMPFKSKQFDSVSGFNALQDVPPNKIKQAVKEIHRVLKDGGVFYHSSELPSARFYSSCALERKILRTGGTVLDYKQGVILNFARKLGNALLKNGFTGVDVLSAKNTLEIPNKYGIKELRFGSGSISSIKGESKNTRVEISIPIVVARKPKAIAPWTKKRRGRKRPR